MDTNFIANPTVVDPVAKLSSVLSNANAVQSLRNAQLQNQIGQNTLQQGNNQTEVSDANLADMKYIQGVTQNLDKYKRPDDTLDLDKFASDVYRGVKNPENAAKAVQHVSTAQQGITTAKQAITGLASDQRQIAGGMLGTAIGQSADVQSKVVNQILADPNIGPAIRPAFEALASQAMNSPDQATRDKALTTLQKFAYTAQFKKPDATTISTDKGTVFSNGNPASDTPVGPLAGTPTLAPPNAVGTSATGAPVVINPAKKTASNLTPTDDGSGAAPPVTSYPVGESKETADARRTALTQTQSQMQEIPQRNNVYREIIDLTNKGTLTGEGGKLLNKWAGALGYPMESGSDFNTLGKMLEQQAARTAQAMGLHTDAGAASAKAMSGSTSYDDKTIGRIARLNAANEAALPEYLNGVKQAQQKYAQAHPGVDPVFAKDQFDKQWAATYDPRITRLSNAVQNNDVQDIKEVMESVGMKGSIQNGRFVPSSAQTPAFKTLMGKVQKMKQLSATGDLGQ
jgi:hypothetical protein